MDSNYQITSYIIFIQLILTRSLRFENVRIDPMLWVFIIQQLKIFINDLGVINFNNVLKKAFSVGFMRFKCRLILE